MVVFARLSGYRAPLPGAFTEAALGLRGFGFRPEREWLKWSDTVVTAGLPRGTHGLAPELSDTDMVAPLGAASVLATDVCRLYDLLHQDVAVEIAQRVMVVSAPRDPPRDPPRDAPRRM